MSHILLNTDKFSDNDYFLRIMSVGDFDGVLFCY